MFEFPFDNMSFPLRRRFLQQAGLGFGSLALASMLQEDSKAASISNDPLALKQLQHELRQVGTIDPHACGGIGVRDIGCHVDTLWKRARSC